MSTKTTLVLLGTICFGAHAQTDTLQTTYLQEVVISQNRTERSLDEVDRRVTVLHKKDFERMPYQNVAELMGNQPGLFVVGQGQNPGANQSLFLRGANSNQVNILIDGVRLADPSTPGGALDLSELSLVNVERIEILRGSHGTMYGTSGIGGVINIITTKEASGWQLTGEMQAGVFKEDGASWKHAVSGRYQLENGLYAAAGYDQLLVNGLNAAQDTTSAGYSRPDSDDFRKTDFFGQFGYRGGNFSANALYKQTSQRADLDQGAFQDDDNYFLEFDRSVLNYQAAYEWKNASIQFQGGYSSLIRTTENDSSIVDEAGAYDSQFSSSENEGVTLTNELQALFGRGSATLLVGAGQYSEKMNLASYYYSSLFGGFELSNNLDSLDISSVSSYVFAQSVLRGDLLAPDWENLTLTLGTRLTHHDAFGHQAAFEITPGYRLGSNRIFFNFSTGYKNPSLTQLYDPSFVPGYAASRGNPDLQPERSQSLELGWMYFGQSLRLNASLYRMHVRQVIEYVYLWSASRPVDSLDFSDHRGDTYLNLSSLTTSGLEVGFDWDMSKKWNAAAHFSYMSGSVAYRPDDVDRELAEDHHVQLFSNGAFLSAEVSDNQLVRRPASLANASLTYRPVSTMEISARYRYVAARSDSFYHPALGPFGALGSLEIDPYQLVDLVVGYQLGETWQVSGRIENAFNTRYQEIQGFNTRGRGFYLRVVGRVTSGK